jgi:hypothetical protein
MFKSKQYVQARSLARNQSMWIQTWALVIWTVTDYDLFTILCYFKTFHPTVVTVFFISLLLLSTPDACSDGICHSGKLLFNTLGLSVNNLSLWDLQTGLNGPGDSTWIKLSYSCHCHDSLRYMKQRSQRFIDRVLSKSRMPAACLCWVPIKLFICQYHNIIQGNASIRWRKKQSRTTLHMVHQVKTIYCK